MAVRLSRGDQARFVRDFDSSPVVQYRHTMNGTLDVPDTLWHRIAPDLSGIRYYQR